MVNRLCFKQKKKRKKKIKQTEKLWFSVADPGGVGHAPGL